MSLYLITVTSKENKKKLPKLWLSCHTSWSSPSVSYQVSGSHLIEYHSLAQAILKGLNGFLRCRRRVYLWNVNKHMYAHTHVRARTHTGKQTSTMRPFGNRRVSSNQTLPRSKILVRYMVIRSVIVITFFFYKTHVEAKLFHSLFTYVCLSVTRQGALHVLKGIPQLFILSSQAWWGGGGGSDLSIWTAHCFFFFFGAFLFVILLFLYELKKRTRPASSHGHVEFLHVWSFRNMIANPLCLPSFANCSSLTTIVGLEAPYWCTSVTRTSLVMVHHVALSLPLRAKGCGGRQASACITNSRAGKSQSIILTKLLTCNICSVEYSQTTCFRVCHHGNLKWHVIIVSSKHPTKANLCLI